MEPNLTYVLSRREALKARASPFCFQVNTYYFIQDHTALNFTALIPNSLRRHSSPLQFLVSCKTLLAKHTFIWFKCALVFHSSKGFQFHCVAAWGNPSHTEILPSVRICLFLHVANDFRNRSRHSGIPFLLNTFKKLIRQQKENPDSVNIRIM